VAFAGCNAYRRTMLARWRRSVEAIAMDEFCTAHGPGRIGDLHRATGREACLAMERMASSRSSRGRRALMTNRRRHTMTPPDLAASGFSARQVADGATVDLLQVCPELGHADLLECPEEAVSIVSAFEDVLRKERRGEPFDWCRAVGASA
jgi:hypothetical protein